MMSQSELSSIRVGPAAFDYPTTIKRLVEEVERLQETLRVIRKINRSAEVDEIIGAALGEP